MRKGQFVAFVACLWVACGADMLASSVDEMRIMQNHGLSVLREVANSAVRDAEMLKSSKAYSMMSEAERTTLESAVGWCRLVLNLETNDFPSAITVAPAVLSRGSLPGAAAISVVSEEWRMRAPEGVRPGDLVFARENGLFALTFWGASTREKRFTHVGIVVGDGENHEIMTADGGLNGAACISWREFFVDALDGAVYRPTPHIASGEIIARVAQGMVGVPFDPAFDLKTNDRLYCSEFVRIAVNKAAGRDVIGTSRRGDFEYVAIDDCYRSGFEKVFDAKEWKPPVAVTPAASVSAGSVKADGQAVDGSVLVRSASTKVKDTRSSTNRVIRTIIVPMH